MTEREDIDELAAEYVLGTLPAAERSAIAERRLTDAKLDQALSNWEQRLAPLLEAVPPVAPPEKMFEKIQSRIASSLSVISLQQHRRALAKQTRTWRIAAGGMTALAASLAGFILWTGAATHSSQPTYVAVLQEESQKPAFLMTVNMKTHMCSIKTVTPRPDPDKNYELWMVHEDLKQPMSLGVIAKSDIEEMPMVSYVDPDLNMNATFAVSLEPAGGSPTGAPTGPVMYAGRLVQSTQ